MNKMYYLKLSNYTPFSVFKIFVYLHHNVTADNNIQMILVLFQYFILSIYSAIASSAPIAQFQDITPCEV